MEEAALDLSGEWKGRWEASDGNKYEVLRMLKKTVAYRKIPKIWKGPAYLLYHVADEGNGGVQVDWEEAGCLGIYVQQGDSLTICFCDPKKGRPTSFRAGNGQHLLILHRVKPQK
jgi:hypothetical protein